MPIFTAQIELAQDVPQLIVGSDNQAQEVHIHNHEHAQGRDLYIGATNAVDETTGHHVLAETDIKFWLNPGDELWGMTPDGAGCLVTVIRIQKED